MEWFVLWCFCAVIAGGIAASKGRSGVGWFFLGLFIGPFAVAVARSAGPKSCTDVWAGWWIPQVPLLCRSHPCRSGEVPLLSERSPGPCPREDD